MQPPITIFAMWFDLSRLIALMLAGNALIYSAFAFINGRLWPEGLTLLYTWLPGHGLRLALAMIIFFLPANFLFAYGFRLSSAVLAGSMYMLAAVVGMVVNAMLLDGSRLSWLSAGGVLLVMLGCILVVQGLQPALPRP